MPKTIYVRDFPADLHYALKVKAAVDQVSLRELFIRYCQEGLERDKKPKKRKGG